MKKLLLNALLLLLPMMASAQIALVNCAPGTPCNSSTGPANTGTGDPAWQAFGKVNNSLTTLNGYYSGAGGTLPISKGGTGATSFAAAALVTFTGTPVSGNCVEWLSSTVVEDAGAACGTGGTYRLPAALFNIRQPFSAAPRPSQGLRRAQADRL